MERLLIDFSHVYGQDRTSRTPRSVYNTNINAEYHKTKEAPKLSFEDMLSDSIKNVNNLQICPCNILPKRKII